MKQVAIIFIFFLSHGASAQDTLNYYKMPNGESTFWLLTKTDTSIICLYSNNKIQSVQPLKGGVQNGIYKRWYENGKLMWEKSVINNIANGNATFYNMKGDKIAQLIYKDGVITDTVFVKPNSHLVIGHFTYNSKIYGGMEREDGGTNISESSGPMQFYKMYVALVDSFKKPQYVSSFETDVNGDFISDLPEGFFSFYPNDLPIENILPGDFYLRTIENHGLEAVVPFLITSQSIKVLNFCQYEVGFAP